MKILVCITHVPDTTTKISFTPDGKEFNGAGVTYIIGPYDDFALARAIELKEAQGGSVTVLNVGLVDTEPTIRKALAIGADDAIRIDVQPQDGWQVAQEIATICKAENYDLILMGRESIDHNGGQVHGMVGELLGIPSVSPVMRLEIAGTAATVAKEIEGGKEVIELSLPFVAGCQEPIAEWKIPNMRGIMGARTKPLKVVPATVTGSKVAVSKFSMPPSKGAVKMISPDDMASLVNLLKTEAKVL
jgi:electron transfer flavoprotein beta subunit